jgi:hypothetical protein
VTVQELHRRQRRVRCDLAQEPSRTTLIDACERLQPEVNQQQLPYSRYSCVRLASPRFES